MLKRKWEMEYCVINVWQKWVKVENGAIRSDECGRRKSQSAMNVASHIFHRSLHKNV